MDLSDGPGVCAGAQGEGGASLGLLSAQGHMIWVGGGSIVLCPGVQEGEPWGLGSGGIPGSRQESWSGLGPWVWWGTDRQAGVPGVCSLGGGLGRGSLGSMVLEGVWGPGSGRVGGGFPGIHSLGEGLGGSLGVCGPSGGLGSRVSQGSGSEQDPLGSAVWMGFRGREWRWGVPGVRGPGGGVWGGSLGSGVLVSRAPGSERGLLWSSVWVGVGGLGGGPWGP